MKRREVVVALGQGALLAVAGAAASAPPSSDGVAGKARLRRGDAVSLGPVTLLDGRRWEAAHWQGRAAVIVFWALGCPFCARHNAHVSRLHRQAQTEGLPLSVLGVARQGRDEALRAHALAHDWPFPNAAAASGPNAAFAAALRPRSIVPYTLAIDRDGRLADAVAGEMFEEDVLAWLALARWPADPLTR